MTKNTTIKRATFTVRMPLALKEQLESAATYNGHSLNTEILLRLKESAIEDQYEQLRRDSAQIKTMLRELLDKD